MIHAMKSAVRVYGCVTAVGAKAWIGGGRSTQVVGSEGVRMAHWLLADCAGGGGESPVAALVDGFLARAQVGEQIADGMVPGSTSAGSMNMADMHGTMNTENAQGLAMFRDSAMPPDSELDVNAFLRFSMETQPTSEQTAAVSIAEITAENRERAEELKSLAVQQRADGSHGGWSKEQLHQLMAAANDTYSLALSLNPADPQLRTETEREIFCAVVSPIENTQFGVRRVSVFVAGSFAVGEPTWAVVERSIRAQGFTTANFERWRMYTSMSTGRTAAHIRETHQFYGTAIETFEKFLDSANPQGDRTYLMQPDNPFVTVPPAAAREQGLRLFDGGEFTRAALAFERCVQADPTSSEDWLQLGRCVASGGDPARSISCFQQVARIEEAWREDIRRARPTVDGRRVMPALRNWAWHHQVPKDADRMMRLSRAHLGIGIGFAELQDHERALVHLRAFIEERPDGDSSFEWNDYTQGAEAEGAHPFINTVAVFAYTIETNRRYSAMGEDTDGILGLRALSAVSGHFQDHVWAEVGSDCGLLGDVRVPQLSSSEVSKLPSRWMQVAMIPVEEILSLFEANERVVFDVVGRQARY